MSLKSNLYEASCLISAESVDDARESLNKIREQLEGRGAMVTDSGHPDKRRLGYAINGCPEAYFATIKFVSNENSGKKFDEAFRGKTGLLRHMLVKYKVKENTRKERRVNTTKPGLEHKDKIEPVPAADIEKIDKQLEEILGK